MPLDPNQLKQMVISTNDESLQSMIHILHCNIEDIENEKAIIVAINSLLSNTKTLVRGLQLVNALILYCSLDAVVENAIKWASYCIVHNAQDNTKEIKLKTLAKIITETADAESFNNKFLSEHLPPTLKACLTYSCNAEKIACLNCLTHTMRRYPSWFGNHKNKIDAFLVKFLEKHFESKVDDAAIAFHFLQQTGSAGMNGANYINNFSSQLKKLCSTVHMLYDIFFESVNELNNPEKIDGEVYTFSQFPSGFDSHRILEAVASRIINCLVFIKTMILKSFPVVKQIIPKHIVDIISRGLAVHICISENILLEGSSHSLLLYKIQLQLLQLFRVFMIGHLSSLLPFSYILTKSLLNMLKRTHECACFTTVLTYKTDTYKTLKDLLLLTKSLNQSHLQETLIPILLNDVSPMKTKLLLNLNIANKNKSRLTQKLVSGTRNNVYEKKINIIDNSLKENNCIYALDVLQCLFSTCSLSVKDSLLQEVVSFVVKTLGDLGTNRIVSPYANIECQIKLHEVLISFFKQELNIKNLPPIHLVTTILKRGLNNINHKFSQTCSEGLELLEKISQPVCNSLYICDYKAQLNESSAIDQDDFNKIVCEEIGKISNEANYENAVENSKITVAANEKIVTKEINILSNILISQSNGVKENEKEDEDNIYNLSKIEQSGREKIINLAEENVAPICENIAIPSSEVVRENHSEEPPTKKKREADNTLEDMFSSFQDVVQDSKQ